MSSATPTALITGATSGIGLSISHLLAKDGYRLVLVARNKSNLETTAQMLSKQYGVEVIPLACDLAKQSAPQEIRSAIQNRNLMIHTLVNNAGFGTFGPFSKVSLSESLGLIQVNVTALTELTKLFLGDMIENKSGRILNIASTAAFQPGPLMAVYYASKAYVLSFSEALAREVKNTGVTVTTLCPGPTQTGFQKRAKMDASRLLKTRFWVMDSETVAYLGYEGLKNGKTVVIPGFINKMMVWSTRFMPRKLVTAAVEVAQAATK